MLSLGSLSTVLLVAEDIQHRLNKGLSDLLVAKPRQVHAIKLDRWVSEVYAVTQC